MIGVTLIILSGPIPDISDAKSVNSIKISKYITPQHKTEKPGDQICANSEFIPEVQLLRLEL